MSQESGELIEMGGGEMVISMELGMKQIERWDESRMGRAVAAAAIN